MKNLKLGQSKIIAADMPDFDYVNLFKNTYFGKNGRVAKVTRSSRQHNVIVYYEDQQVNYSVEKGKIIYARQYGDQKLFGAITISISIDKSDEETLIKRMQKEKNWKKHDKAKL